MPRIRTIKPEFFTSPSTAKLSSDARILFIAMWCWADDYGKGETNLNGLLGLAFPESDDKDRKELQSLCKEIQSACKVEFYVAEERAYYAIPSWDKHQKTQRKADSRIPDPDDPRSAPDPRFHTDAEPPLKSEEIQSQRNEAQALEREQGNRGTGEKEQGRNPSSIADADGPTESFELIEVPDPRPSEAELFERFWAEYPRKDGKKRAREKFTQALKRADAEDIIDGAHRYNMDPNRSQAFTKQATTWLNGEHWEDPPLPPRSDGRTNAQDRRSEQIVDLVTRNMPQMDERRQLGT